MKRLISSAMRIFFLLICTVCFSPTVSFAQDLWTYIGETQTDPSEETIGPHIYQTFVLDEFWLENILSEAPMEFTIGAEVIMTLPTPTGGYESVRIEESPIFSPTLQAQYPEVRTYRAQGLDDPTATGRFDRTAARISRHDDLRVRSHPTPAKIGAT